MQQYDTARQASLFIFLFTHVQQVDAAAQQFLHLEKYVNLNFTGFHKILKKHDKRLPNPCKSFYISRLHEQGWVKGDHSEVIVLMSAVYGALRGDEVVEEKESEKQVSIAQLPYLTPGEDSVSLLLSCRALHVSAT